ncbi:MAG TPA: hypothetical protein VMD47_07655 [Candidatus Acidoferrales bacterium]|nr:hypothetical protein [Candidatus Acidoferrales bacterium]
MTGLGSVRLLFMAAALSAVALAACGGGSGGGPGAGAPMLPTTQPPAQSPDKISLVIKVPQPSGTASARRRPNYVSAGTQSIGVVVASQGYSPSPAQYTNLSSCPLVSGVTTCTITVQAIPGSDTFTITAYSGTNGSGSVLSVGSITATIVSGQTSSLSVSLGGVIASMTLSTVNADLPLSQAMTVNVSAQDASGDTIVGTYDNPIALSGSDLVISPTALPDSTTASNVTVSWAQSYAGTTATTLSASGDSATATLSITPASGFAYYTTGTNETDDWSGLKMIASGNYLYYAAVGKTQYLVGSGFIAALNGAVHQFNLTTLTDSEIALPSEPTGLAVDSTGALWIAGGPNPTPSASPFIYRLSSFNAGSLTQIAVPGTNVQSPTDSTYIRAVTPAASGTNMWFTDLLGERLVSIPVAGPYTTGAISTVPLPSPPAAAPFANGPRTIDYLSGSNALVVGLEGGFVDVYNLGTDTFSQYVTNLQTSLGASTLSNLYDAATDGTNVYVGQVGDATAFLADGDMEEFTPSDTFTTLNTVSAPLTEPIIPAYGDGLVYYADFGIGGLGYTNPSTGVSRVFPMQLNDNFFYGPDGLAVMSDGTAWFTCYGNSDPEFVAYTVTYQPICIGHTIYESTWGLWPSSTVGIDGAGAESAQIVGIMEAAGSNSGPFTVTSNNTSVCTIATPAPTSDHNFTITGVAAGACTVTVKDASAHTQSMSVTVTTTTGTVQRRRRGGIALP